MNKRFKELAFQAGGITYDDDNNESTPMLIGEDQIEHFAEMIVTRCASIVSLYKRDNMQDKAIAETMEQAYREIKLSFGLKL